MFVKNCFYFNILAICGHLEKYIFIHIQKFIVITHELEFEHLICKTKYEYIYYIHVSM